MDSAEQVLGETLFGWLHVACLPFLFLGPLHPFTTPYRRSKALSSALQVLIAAPPLDGRELRHCRGGRVLTGMLVCPLAAAPADPPPASHQHHAPKQVVLDHQGGEARHIPPRREPAQSIAIQGPSCGRARSDARTEAGLGGA